MEGDRPRPTWRAYEPRRCPQSQARMMNKHIATFSVHQLRSQSKADEFRGRLHSCFLENA